MFQSVLRLKPTLSPPEKREKEGEIQPNRWGEKNEKEREDKKKKKRRKENREGKPANMRFSPDSDLDCTAKQRPISLFRQSVVK